MPNSLCGNSYYSTELDPNHYWKFVTTVYDGDFKTKFRIMFSYIDPHENPKNTRDYRENMRIKKDLIIYSYEFEGYINPFTILA